MRAVVIALAGLLVSLAPSVAQDGTDPFASAFADGRDAATGAEGQWGVDPTQSSAVLARGPWSFIDMSTLSWPDGRQAVVTMWRSELGEYARCFDYFDATMVAVGGKCERTGTGL